MTALHWACFFRDHELITALLNAGADVSCQNTRGQTPFDLYQLTISNLHMYYSNAGGIIADNCVHFTPTNYECLTDLLFHCDKLAINRGFFSKEKAPTFFAIRTCDFFAFTVNAYLPTILQQRNAMPLDPALLARLQQTAATAVATQYTVGSSRLFNDVAAATANQTGDIKFSNPYTK